MPRKIFTAGEVLAASDVNTFLMDQSVMTFADGTARSSAIGTATQGMVTYLEDEDKFEYWNGTAYEPFGAGETALTLEYLVIAGGGGGGGNRAGGGGAGGYRSSVVGETSGYGGFAEAALVFGTAVGQIDFATNYTVTVGAGGAGGANTIRGTNGENSVFVITSTGGGGGGAYDGTNSGLDGGSGGGTSRADAVNFVIGYGTNGQGSPGGTPRSNAGGGGGGASDHGQPAAGTDSGGAGGAGTSSSITGSAVTRAGGGGGGSVTLGSGGTGGGGNGGSSSVAATAATVNTGGGGGGGGTGTLTGANGGSGIVILKYPDSLTITIGAGLTGSTSTAGGFSVTTITVGTGNVSWAA
jgi:hypothetical protein